MNLVINTTIKLYILRVFIHYNHVYFHSRIFRIFLDKVFQRQQEIYLINLNLI